MRIQLQLQLYSSFFLLFLSTFSLCSPLSDISNDSVLKSSAFRSDSIQSGLEESDRDPRQFFFSTTTSITITAGTVTSTLTTTRSCFSNLANAAPTCVPTLLSGRKKREFEIVDDIPLLVDSNGQIVDLREKIVASRVSRDAIEEESTTSVDSNLNEIQNGRSGRFVTFIKTTTILTTATTTVTTTALGVHTLAFTSIGISQCFPLVLMASLGIAQC